MSRKFYNFYIKVYRAIIWKKKWLWAAGRPGLILNYKFPGTNHPLNLALNSTFIRRFCRFDSLQRNDPLVALLGTCRFDEKYIFTFRHCKSKIAESFDITFVNVDLIWPLLIRVSYPLRFFEWKAIFRALTIELPVIL